MRPKDLIRFGRISYSKQSSISSWASTEFIESGLFSGEIELFEVLPTQSGKLLMLGMGGGREAIFLAKAGFHVTGVDFVEEHIKKALSYARQIGIQLQGIYQEISKLNFSPSSFDVVWYSCSIYSSIPGRSDRIDILKRVSKWLTSQGVVVCNFYWNPFIRKGKFRWWVGKAFSWLTFGNIKCERGDILKNNLEFLHAFNSKEQLCKEFAEAGFEVVQFFFPENSNNAGALLRKRQ